MKKKILLFVVLLITVISLTACNSSNITTRKNTTQDSIVTELKETAKENTFEDFEKLLTDNGYTFNKLEKAAAMVGAQEGYLYVLSNNDKYEVYRFYVDDDSFKKVVSTGRLTVELMEMTLDATIKNNMAIYSYPNNTERDNIISLFNKL